MARNDMSDRISGLFCSLGEQKQDHFLGILEALDFAAHEAVLTAHFAGCRTDAEPPGLYRAVRSAPAV